MSRVSNVVPATLVLGLSLAAAPAQAEALTKASLAPAVSVVEASRREIVESVVVTGTLVPRDEILVTPEIDGFRVTEILVEEGARVQRGQVLARLSHDLIDRQIAQQDALVAKATASVPQAASNIEQGEAAALEARLGLERAQSLMKTGNTTAVVMEGRTSTLRQAESRLSFARNGLDIARADLAQAKAVRDELALRLARTEIRAPEAGIVSRRTARVGITASASAEPLFRLIARGEIELEGEVVETKLPLLREGSPAWIEIGDGARIQGSVRAVYPEVDKANRLGKVRVRLDPDLRLRIGTFARGGVEIARTRDVTVPQASVLYGGPQRSSVLVVSGDRVEARSVKTGLSDDDDIEIRSGLADGERIVARAGSFLRDGDRVRPVLEAAPAPAMASVPSPQDSAEARAP